jgi:uncharacterized protein
LIRLRGHHLICLHFFSGESFPPEFAENLRAIVQNAEAGKTVNVCMGPDDICIRCPYLQDETCLYNKDADEEVRNMDRTAQALLNAEAGEEIHWQDMKEKVPGVFAVWSELYCNGCDWKQICEENREFSRLIRERHA